MASSGPPIGAVIIPHYNDVARLARCLEALIPQMNAQAELVVVDNGSTQPLAPVRERYPNVRIETASQKGAAIARNVGVGATDAPWLFFLDADCVPAPDWVARAIEIAQTTKADIVGGRVDVFDETPAPRSGAEVVETVFAFRCRDYVERGGFSVTANMLTRRDVFVATGPFVNGLPEDREWCLRAARRGYRIVYDDDLRVSHPTRADWPALRRKWRRLTEEAYAYHRVEGAGRFRWGLRAVATVLSGPLHAPQIATRPGLSAGERVRGIATLLQIRALRGIWMVRQIAGGAI